MRRRSVEKERHWREVLGRFEGSGLTIRAFCRRSRIKEHQFHTWRRELRLRDADKPDSAGARRKPRGAPTIRPAAFAAVHIVESAQDKAPAIEIIIGNGKRVAVRPGFEPATLTQVLRVVEGWSC
jgi:transposase